MCGVVPICYRIGLALVVAQFDFLDQFRWIAWFEIACGVLTMVAIVLIFRDPLFPTSRPSCNSILKRVRRRESVSDNGSMAPKKDATPPLTPMGILVSVLCNRVLHVTVLSTGTLEHSS